MKDDPIVAEVRKAREEYAARFGFDLHAMCEDLRRLTEESRAAGHEVVSLPPKHLPLPSPAHPHPHPEGGLIAQGKHKSLTRSVISNTSVFKAPTIVTPANLL